MSGVKAWTIIAGVGPGLSASVARKFSSTYNIALIARKSASFEALVKEIEEKGGKAFGFCADVSDSESCAKAIKDIKNKMGNAKLAAAVYNVGGTFSKTPFLELELDGFEAGWRTGGRGVFNFAQGVIPLLLEEAKREFPPTLIFTSATAAMRGSAETSSYSTGKFALRSIAQSLAREFGPKGIHVAQTVIDGVIESEETKDWLTDHPDAKLDPDAIGDAYWYLHTQSRTCFTHELDLRPYIEKW